MLARAINLKGCGVHVSNYEGVSELLRKADAQIAASIRSGAQVVFYIFDYYHYPLPTQLTRLPLEQRVQAIKSDFMQRIEASRKDKVRCHVVVYETEAWILADEEVLAKRLKLKALPAWLQPEQVNDMKPPSKILQELFRKNLNKKSYDKYKDGLPLLESIDNEKVYAKCPTFRQLVDDLRNYCQQP